MHYPQGHYIRMALPPKRRKKIWNLSKWSLTQAEGCSNIDAWKVDGDGPSNSFWDGIFE